MVELLQPRYLQQQPFRVAQMLSVYQEFGDVPLQLDRAFWKKSVGGKAFFLSQLYQAGIPVPAGIILRACPETAGAWLEVVEWLITAPILIISGLIVIDIH